MYTQRYVPEYQVVPRKIVDHNCQLPTKTEVRIENYIRDGIFVGFRRSFRQLFLLSKHHPMSRTFLKSTAQMETAIHKHIKEHYYTIHPFSKGRFWWEMIMMNVYLVYYFMIPIEEMIYSRVWSAFVAIKTVLDVLTLIDVILWFFTGFYNVEKQKIVLSLKKIAKRYVTTYFFFDVIPLAPFDLVWFQDAGPQLIRKIIIFKFINTLKIARFHTFMGYLDLFFTKIGFVSIKSKIIKFGLWYLIITLWIIANITLLYDCIGIDQLSYIPKADVPYDLLKTLFLVLKVTSLVGLNREDFEEIGLSPYTFLLVIIALYLGCILNVAIIAKIMQLICMRASTHHSYNSLNKEIHEYMKYKALPPFLRAKIKRFVKFKFQNTVLRENQIWKSLNRLLREEILLHNCDRLIKKVDFFKDLPIDVLLRIITKLKSEIYLPNDIIVLAGVTGYSMYFIYIGTVAVYTSTEREICHLSEGDHFGEIALLKMEPRTATVAAVTDCELLKLNRRDFVEAIQPFPEIRNKMAMMAAQRMKATMNVMQETPKPRPKPAPAPKR